MAEPTVQVPVSLIERFLSLAERADEAWVNGTAGAFRALLSQPTPSAEPPRIADMAPGTTFTAEHPDTGRPTRFERCEDEQHAPHTVFDTDGGSFWKPSAVDPSTIRDVTPPATESTK